MKAGYFNNRHYTEYWSEVKRLKKEKQYDSAIELLLKIIDATEAESRAEGWGVAPAYYEELANIYKKLGLIEEERQVLVRFSKQRHAPGVKPLRLLDRLRIL